MAKKKIISFSLEIGLIARLKKLGDGNLSGFVNRLLKESIETKELSLAERVERLEDKLDSILKLMKQQGC